MSEIDPAQRIVVTGMGAISPLGMDVESSWENILDGQSGIRYIKDDVLIDFQQLGVSVGAVIDGFSLDNDKDLGIKLNEKDRRKLHRSAQFALWAGAQALRQAGLFTGFETSDSRGLLSSDIDPDAVGVSIGTGIGGAELIGPTRVNLDKGKRIQPTVILNVLPERVASASSMVFGARGPVHAVIGACATGNMNIISAARILKLGEADVMLAGGTEAQISPEGIALFDRTGAMDTSVDPSVASRPFHADEKGFVMGEGAGVLVLETLAHAQKRGATVLAELAGYAETGDAYHETAPSGEGAVKAITRALKMGQVRDGSRFYVNAHATGTGGDATEFNAIYTALQSVDILGISSTKSATGHMLGAAGAFESIVSVKALQTGIMPPNAKLGAAADPIDSGYIVTEAESIGDIQYALNDSFGFGGLNAVTLFKRAKQ